MTTEKISTADIGACCDLYNHYIRNTCFTLEEEEVSHEEFAARVERICRTYTYIVARNDAGEVVGYAYLDTFNPRSAYRRTADLSIYVSHRHLHEHIGGILLAAIEKEAKEYGITTLISIITSENAGSVAFHEKNGFIREGTIHDVAVKFGKTLSIDYYRKPLR